MLALVVPVFDLASIASTDDFGVLAMRDNASWKGIGSLTDFSFTSS